VFVRCHNPYRVVIFWLRFPRGNQNNSYTVRFANAPLSQPWALLRNPFGILALQACLSREWRHHGRAVRKRRIYLALVGLGIVIGGIVLLSKPEREPEYEGKKLSQWVDRYGESFARIGSNLPPLEDDPIYRIGTNGIPFLLKWLQYEQPAWKRSLYHAVNFALDKVNPDWEITDRWERRANGSGIAFYILGPAGSGVVPELIRLARDPTTPPESASRAAGVLQALRLRELAAEQERVLRQMRSNALQKVIAP